MNDDQTQFFPVSGARYEIEDVLAQIDDEEKNGWEWAKSGRKWEMLMKIYERLQAIENTHKIVLAFMAKLEDAAIEKTDSSLGLETAITRYKQLLPIVENEFKREQKRQIKRMLNYLLPNARDLKLEDSKEVREAHFLSNWGAKTRVKEEMKIVQTNIDFLKTAKMNEVERRVAIEIAEWNLRELKETEREIDALYHEHVTRFRIYELK